MQPIEPIPRAVDLTRPAGLACTMGRWETSRLHHAYVGPEHLLLGLLRQGDNPAARVLVAHGLDLETVRAEIDRLIAQGVLPGPPSDAELGRQQELQARWLDAQDITPEERARVERLIAQGVLPGPHLGDAAPLATLGIDLEQVAGRLEESFGREAYWQAAERVRNRPSQSAIHRPRACCVVPTRGLLKPGRVSKVRSRWRVRRRRPSVAGSPAPRWPTRTALAARSGRRHARR
jgi:ATP-dependent Clp protease ATP-binding subunit ClpA